MSEKLAKLLAVSSGALASPPTPAALDRLADGESAQLRRELCAFLSDKNGFYAFESALLLRPLENNTNSLGIFQWNSPATWISKYKADLSEALFFAEDIFGVQFCLTRNWVGTFDPETGRFENIAETLEGWSQWILEDHRIRTGWPLAHQWQRTNGPLAPGARLLPKVPFVCGGAFSSENLYCLNDVEGMQFRASIANQLIGVPDGAKIIFDIQGKKIREK